MNQATIYRLNPATGEQRKFNSIKEAVETLGAETKAKGGLTEFKYVTWGPLIVRAMKKGWIAADYRFSRTPFKPAVNAGYDNRRPVPIPADPSPSTPL